jgi:membrane protein YdbS with pleckstrin-like domain
MTLRARLLDFLRVPPAPSAPAGDHDVRIFRAAPNFLRYRLFLWLLKNASAVIGVILGIFFLRQMPNWIGQIEAGGIVLSADLMTTIFRLLEVGAVLGLVTQAAWSLALLRLDFEQRWYIVSDRSLRIREGIVRMHEKTMTFANIQQVTTEQGPLQRLLGIADLQVRTAGGGGDSKEEGDKAKHDLHVAYFRGVANAEAIRTTIRERLRRHADAGLGDPDDPGHIAPVTTSAAASAAPLLTAARALADEARALRRVALTRAGAARSG